MAQIKAIVDKLLTNVSSAYIPSGYVSEELLPEVPVKQDTGLLGSYGDSHLRIETTLMAGEGGARRVKSITRSTDAYHIEEHGLEGVVTEADRRNVEAPFDAERDEVIGLSTLLWLSKEKGLADALTSTSIITQNETLAGQSQFSDYVNSDPVKKAKDAQVTIYDSVGMEADTAVIPFKVAKTLRFHPAILDSLGYKENRAGKLTDDELAHALGVQRILIPNAQFNSATEGQTSVRQAVWGNHMVFCVAPKKAEKYQTSVGYRMVLSGKKPRSVFKYNINNPPNATGIIVQDAYDQFLSDVNAAYLFRDAIA